MSSRAKWWDSLAFQLTAIGTIALAIVAVLGYKHSNESGPALPSPSASSQATTVADADAILRCEKAHNLK